MSLKALAWAFEARVDSSSQKLVLLALANYAGDSGKTYPSVLTVCNLTCMEHKAVRRSIKALTTLGLVVDTGNRTGDTGQVRVYQLPVGARHEPLEDDPKGVSLEEPKTPKIDSKTPERLPEDTPKRVAEPITGNRSTKSLKRFSVPTFPEMELYAAKIGLPPSEINAFFDHHEARGWKLRGVAMVSWEAAMRTWRKNWETFRGGKQSSDQPHIRNGKLLWQP